ncbi:MAG: DUF2642 domain-containing protein [Chlorobi bacterium]|nr:DUF2642 domain-containing protein [Chlorobiota bacterium]
MKKQNTKKTISALIFIMIANLLFSQSGLNVDKVTVFTDANSYVQKSGAIEAKNGVYELSGEQLPPARFGTLEITDNENTILNITSSIKPREYNTKPTNINTAQDLLLQNKGINLEIKTAQKNISGELLEVFPDYIVIKGDKTILVKTADILSFSFDSEPVFIYTPKPKKQIKPMGIHGNKINEDATLTIHFSSDGTKNINLKYLQKGLSWSPMYTLKLLDGKVANLILQAEVINDVEDLKMANIDLVLGTPNFKYDMYLTDLLDYSNILDPFYENTRNGSSRSSYLSAFKIPLIAKEDTWHNTQKTDEQQHDFYVHKLNDISLKKNSRGLYKVLDTEITYRHIYECDLIELDYENHNYRRNEDIPKNIVYHSLLIENKSDVLFGAGSVLVVDGSNDLELPLAQNKLDYIPPKSEGTIKLTENHEIEISHKETITNKSASRFEFWGRYYFKATIKGSVKIKNLKSENIEIAVRDFINGEVINVGSNGEILYQKQPVYSPNSESKVKWTLDVKPGEEKEITYSYWVYIK